MLPDLPARDDREVAVDVDGVRRDDDRDVGLRGGGAPAELLHRRPQRRVEVDVAVRRDAGEDEAHGSDAIRETRSSRKRSRVDVDPDVGVLGASRVTPAGRRRCGRRRTPTASRSSTLRCSVVDERRVDDVRDGHRVVDRRAVEAVALPWNSRKKSDELGDEASGAAGVAQPLGVRRA